MSPSFLFRPAAGRTMLLALLLTATVAPAQTIYGLGTITGSNVRNSPVGSQGLIQISATSGAALTLAPTAITGITAGQTLVGIDFRPATTLLYALGYDATTAGTNTRLYLLSTTTSVLTPVGAAARLELGGPAERIGFDFDPVADRVRVVSTNEANYLLDPTTGAIATTGTPLSYSGGTPATPGVGTVAYANAFAGSTATTLFGIDYLNNGLLSAQTLPNTGVLTTRSTVMFGAFGVGNPTDLGLDIYYNPTTNTNIGYLTEVTAVRPNGARSSNTYRLDLATGAATLLGNTVPASQALNFEIRDLAVALPVIPDLTWNGSASTAWATPANWTPPQIPTAANNVTIAGGTPHQPSVTTSQRARHLTLNTGSVLNLTNTSDLTVGGPTPLP